MKTTIAPKALTLLFAASLLLGPIESWGEPPRQPLLQEKPTAPTQKLVPSGRQSQESIPVKEAPNPAGRERVPRATDRARQAETAPHPADLVADQIDVHPGGTVTRPALPSGALAEVRVVAGNCSPAARRTLAEPALHGTLSASLATPPPSVRRDRSVTEPVPNRNIVVSADAAAPPGTTGRLEGREASGSWKFLGTCILVVAAPSSPAVSRAPDAEPTLAELFDADAPGHAWPNAYLLALLSTLIYADQIGDSPDDHDDAFEEELERWGFESVDFIDVPAPGPSTQGAIMSNDELVVLVFRGTETHIAIETGQFDVADIVTDTSFLLVPAAIWGQGAMLHSGFLASHQASWATVWEVVDQHRDNNQRLWIAGHSLGGALAALAAQLLDAKGVPVQGVVTFGAPRIGNGAWATSFNTRFGNRARRWVYGRDPIPRFLLSAGYIHHGVTDNVYEDLRIAIADQEFAFVMPAPGFHMEYDRAIYHSPDFPDTWREKVPPPP
ncbi:MAG: lipase family protein [Methyloceanibacter sp.]